MLKRKNRDNQGAVAFIALSIMSVLLLMILGLVSIISVQVEIMGEIGKSVVAFHAADTGIERLGEAIFVGYHYYQYPYYGECVIEETGGGEGENEEPVIRTFCSYENCQPEIVFNSLECGLPSRCDGDYDCFCPKNKCIGYNYYEYPDSSGTCDGGQCVGCFPLITSNALRCGYEEVRCLSHSDCRCPGSMCVGLEPETISNYPWETPYYGVLPNGAGYKTYIISPESLQSLGNFKGVNRAIEIMF